MRRPRRGRGFAPRSRSGPSPVDGPGRGRRAGTRSVRRPRHAGERLPRAPALAPALPATDRDPTGEGGIAGGQLVRREAAGLLDRRPGIRRDGGDWTSPRRPGPPGLGRAGRSRCAGSRWSSSDDSYSIVDAKTGRPAVAASARAEASGATIDRRRLRCCASRARSRKLIRLVAIRDPAGRTSTTDEILGPADPRGRRRDLVVDVEVEDGHRGDATASSRGGRAAARRRAHPAPPGARSPGRRAPAA